MVNYAKIAGAAGYGKKRKESSSAKKKRQEAVKKYKASIPKSKKPIDTSYTSKTIGAVGSGLPVKAIASPDKNIARQITPGIRRDVLKGLFTLRGPHGARAKFRYDCQSSSSLPSVRY